MNKIAVIYWSGSGNTQAMAEAVAKGAKEAGSTVDLMEVSEADPKGVAGYDGVLLGCPSMGDEVLEEGEFEPFYSDIEADLKDMPVGLFGSYGWGDGQWMRDWQQRAEDAGIKVFEEGLIINETPDDEGLEKCEAFGKRFVSLA